MWKELNWALSSLLTKKQVVIYSYTVFVPSLKTNALQSLSALKDQAMLKRGKGHIYKEQSRSSPLQKGLSAFSSEIVSKNPCWEPSTFS